MIDQGTDCLEGKLVVILGLCRIVLNDKVVAKAIWEIDQFPVIPVAHLIDVVSPLLLYCLVIFNT